MLYVLALLTQDAHAEFDKNSILLLRRCNATFGDGLYSLVGGKVETGETALQAIKREVLEEVALDLPESAFTFVHVMHRQGTDSEFVAIAFVASTVGLQPINNEPTKHDDVRFFSLDALPSNMVPAHEQTIRAVAAKQYYSEHGWNL